ncbi:MAG: galactose-1-phosphate uridylyltransferase [Candidatus Margulisiibacteriota bacterium]
MPELRQNPATKEWVIIAKERARRPDDFASQKAKEEEKPEDKKNCVFCSGNEGQTPKEITAYRSFGTKPDTPGWWIRVVPNKFAALVFEGSTKRIKDYDFFKHMDGIGSHEVIIETPDHDLHIATMDQKQAEEIFLAYRQRYIFLSKNFNFETITIFRNHGKSAGTSIKHPHSQIIAAPVTPTHVRHRLEEAMRYFDDEGQCVYCDMISKEKEVSERIVLETDNFICFEPYAARSPFETYILPKNHQACFKDISKDESKEFAYIARNTLIKIHKSLNNPDYNYLISSSPPQEANEEYYHWHMKIVPKVSAVAGFELGSGIFINTVIPEEAAKFLKAIPV